VTPMSIILQRQQSLSEEPDRRRARHRARNATQKN
jgi:hypothetical protein